MESPGEYLKRERELRGVSLLKIFEATRVPMRFLEALEADNYEVMPHPTFVKGYIKSYCKVLGVDETDAVLRFEVFLKEKAADEEAVRRPSSAARRAASAAEPAPDEGGGRPFPKGLKNAIIAAVSLFIIVAAYYLAKRDIAPPEEAVTPPAAVEPAQQAPPASGYEAAAPATMEPPPSAAPQQAPLQAAPEAVKPPEPIKAAPPEAARKDTLQSPARSGHTLTAFAREMVWIRIGVDGGAPAEVLLREGERFTWKAEDNFSVVVGNAGGVTLTFDGRELPGLGASGEVVAINLSSGGQQRLKRTEQPSRPPLAPGNPADDAKTP